MGLQVRMQENSLREERRSLAALIGRADLPQSIVSGDLEHAWPELNQDQIVEQIASQSPAVTIAEAGNSLSTATRFFLAPKNPTR